MSSVRRGDEHTKPVCIDFVDSNIGMMVGMYKKRMRICEQEGGAAVVMNREKVIKGLECCVSYDFKCNDCPYQNDGGASDELKADALALLKAQEPMDPIRKVIGCGWRYFCSKCGNSIVSQQHFCQDCGQAVKWK